MHYTVNPPSEISSLVNMRADTLLTTSTHTTPSTNIAIANNAQYTTLTFSNVWVVGTPHHLSTFSQICEKETIAWFSG